MKITQYTQEQTSVGGITGRAASASDFADTAGLQAQARGFQQLSQGGFDVGKAVREVQVRKETSEYAAILAEQQLELTKAGEELANANIENGQFEKVYSEKYDQITSAIKQRIPSTQKDRFDADNAELRGRFLEGGIKQQGKRAALRIQENWERTLTASINSVTLNPSNYDAAVKTIALQAASLPGGAEVQEAAMNDAMQNLRGVYAENIIAQNPGGFLAQKEKFADLKNLDKYIRSAEQGVKQKQTEYKVAVRDEINNRMEAYRSGLPVSDELMAADERKARAAGMESTAQQIAELRNNIGFYNESAKMPTGERQNLLRSVVADTANASPDRVAKFKILQDSLKKDQEALAKGEALDLFIARSESQPLPELNLSDEENFPAAMQKYRAAALQASEYYGRPVAPFSKQYLDELDTQFQQANTEQATAIVSRLSTALDETEINALGAVMQRKNTPFAAAAMLTQQGRTEAARYVIDGAKRKDITPTKDVTTALYEKLAPAIADPDAYADVEQSLLNAYKSVAFEKGDVTGAYNEEYLNTAINTVLGGEPLQVNNSAILPYMRPDKSVADANTVRDLLASLDLKTMQEIGVPAPVARNGQPVDIAKIAGSVSLKTAGDGKVIITNPYSNTYAPGTDGREYVLDLREVEKRLMEKNKMRPVMQAPEWGGM